MKIFYHNDVDGLTAATLVQLHVRPKPCKLIAYDYTTHFPIECIEHQEEVWLLDLSFSLAEAAVLDEILSRTKSITWIDHHRSSIETEINSSIYYKIAGSRDSRYSAAALCWMHLHSVKNFSELPLFLRMISDSDTARHEIPEAFELMLGLELKLGLDFSNIIQQLISESQDQCDRNRALCPFLMGLTPLLDRLIKDGKAVLEYKVRLSENYEQNYLCKGTLDEHPAYIINVLAEIPLISMKNLGNVSDLFIGYMYDARSHQYIYRLYTDNPKIDCRKIAEKYGGGGHPFAAGFRHPKNLIQWKEESGRGIGHA